MAREGHSQGMQPKLILQRVYENIPSVKLVDGALVEIMIKQRDCVENLVRNLFNLAFLFDDGHFRPEVESKIAGTPLHSFYLSCSPEERVSQLGDIGRKWLDFTLHFEHFGVVYDPSQGNREVLTGIDNIASLITAMVTPTFSSAGILAASIDKKVSTSSPPSSHSEANAAQFDRQQTCSDERTAKIKLICSILSSSSSMKVSWNKSGSDIPNYSDVSLKFQFTTHDGNRHNEKVKLLVTTDHVCIRHGAQFSC